MINTELAKLKLEIKLYESIEMDEDEYQQEKLFYSDDEILSLLQYAWNWAHMKPQDREINLYILYRVIKERVPQIKNLVSSYQMFEVYLIVPQLYKQLCDYVNS